MTDLDALAPILTLIGLGLEMAGVALGVWEIISTRKATFGFLGRVRHSSMSSHSTIEERARGRMADDRAPTVESHLADVEKKVERLSGEVRALPDEMEKRWRDHVSTVMRIHAADQREQEKALDRFVEDLGTGRLRRCITVVLLLGGGALQIAGVIIAI